MSWIQVPGGKLFRLKYDGGIEFDATPVVAEGLLAKAVSAPAKLTAKTADVSGRLCAPEVDLADFEVGTLDVAGDAKLKGGRVTDGGTVGGVLTADGCRIKGQFTVGRGSKLARCAVDTLYVQLADTEPDSKADVSVSDCDICTIELLGRQGKSRVTKSDIGEELNSSKGKRKAK